MVPEKIGHLHRPDRDHPVTLKEDAGRDIRRRTDLFSDRLECGCVFTEIPEGGLHPVQGAGMEPEFAARHRLLDEGEIAGDPFQGIPQIGKVPLEAAIPECRVHRVQDRRFSRGGGPADRGKGLCQIGRFRAEGGYGVQGGRDSRCVEAGGVRPQAAESRFEIGDGVRNVPGGDFNRKGAADGAFEMVGLVDHVGSEGAAKRLVPVEKGELVMIGHDQSCIAGLGGDHLRRAAKVAGRAAAPSRYLMAETPEDGAVVQVEPDPLPHAIPVHQPEMEKTDHEIEPSDQAGAGEPVLVQVFQLFGADVIRFPLEQRARDPAVCPIEGCGQGDFPPDDLILEVLCEG